ncbi:MAG: hypothetical protein P8Z30_16960, partial [Acidobacteriota bacterium]
MDRSDTPTLLIPLLALLAIAFPFALNLRSPAPSSEKNPQASQPAATQPENRPEKATKRPPPHSAARLIEDFLHARSDQQNLPAGGWQSKYSLDFMIATVPDPVDSRLPQMFDAAIDSIQRAFEASGYVLDRFDLAWSEPAGANAGSGNATGTGSTANPELPRYRREPSLLLFREPDPEGGGKLFLVFLVGETPTSGLHKTAMANALLQLANFFPWGPKPDYPTKELRQLAKKHSGTTIKIMGPSFSGSAVSLDFELRDWLAKIQQRFQKPDRPHLKFRIVSGTATVIDPKEFSRIGEDDCDAFQAVVPPDDETMPAIYKYIQSLGLGRAYSRIAMLTEGGTAYGRANIPVGGRQQDGTELKKSNSGCVQASGQDTKASKQSRKGSEPKVLYLPFPLHISELRSESEKQRQSQQASTPGPIGNPTVSIPLKEGEASQPKETPPSFSGLEVSSAELVLSRLLSTISHEGIHAVGILATDVRDTIFLARQIHQHCPGTLIFTVNSDLLYAHPDVGTATRGMLVFTPYPLFNLNQVWTPPYLRPETRLQFSSQDAEGVYNATLELLGQERLMLDYGEPFPPQGSESPAKPALWVTVVGRNGPVPVGTLPWKNGGDYSYSFERTSQPKDPTPTLDKEGIYTLSSAFGIILVSLVIIGFSVLIILQYHPPANQEGESRFVWASRLFGEPVTPEYQLQARLFLLACLVCLLAAYIVLAVVYSLPVVASSRLGTVPPLNPSNLWVLPVLITTPTAAGLLAVPPVTAWNWWVIFLLVEALIAAGLLLLVCAGVMLGRALWKDHRQKGVLWSGLKVFLGSFIVLGLTLWLADVWLSTAWSSPPEAFFRYIRAFQFFSGLSPLVPLFFLALAGLLWAFCSLRRLHIIEGIRPAGDGDTGKESLLSTGTESFNGVATLESAVRERLESVSAFPKHWFIYVFIIGLFVWANLFFIPFVPSFEGRRFYFLFGWGFLLVYFALTAEFARLCLTWFAFRRLLQRLALHPMQAAYRRYRKSFPGLPRIDLAIPLQALTVLSFSVDRPSDCSDLLRHWCYRGHCLWLRGRNST